MLLVGVELSGLTFQRGDLSKSNLVSTSLFADGAAVLLGSGAGPEVLGGYSTTWPGTEDVMGWELVETGLKVQLSKSVPLIVQEIPRQPDAGLRSPRPRLRGAEHFVLHPGGARSSTPSKRSSASSRADSPTPGRAARVRQHVHVTVLFILERFLRSTECAGATSEYYRRWDPASRRSTCFSDAERHRASGFRYQVWSAGARGRSWMNAALLVLAVALVAIQRLLELRLSRRHERILRARGAVERGREHYPLMVGLHVLWLLSTLVEGLPRGPDLPAYWPIPLAFFPPSRCATGSSSPW